ncbi:MAG TPA: hypothetical protein PK954_24520 [Anaerolineales bacterium]|nr:hypothetical protein [Anaerolineales bacterium]
MQSLVECVPNFSEGRRPEVIAAIVAAIRSAGGEQVQVLDVSSDADHNRTVVTFVGDPEAVSAAAFAGIARAAELIDLDRHQGEHPRLGATDVVPFVPIRGISLADCVALAVRLGERVGREGLDALLVHAGASLACRSISMKPPLRSPSARTWPTCARVSTSCSSRRSASTRSARPISVPSASVRPGP